MTYETFLDYLSKVEILSKALDKEIATCGPELRVVILAGIGSCIGRHILDFSYEERKYILELIEDGIKSPDELFRTQITTGLIEAMPNAAEKVGAFSYLMTAVGAETREYIKAIDQFYGVIAAK